MYRLIYKSRSIMPVDWALVNAIIEASQQQNVSRKITGVLLATRTHFLQVFEGSFEDVNKLYCTIVRDPRHHQIQLVSFTCTEKRIFAAWAMHGIGLFNFNRELSQHLKSSYGEEDGEVRFPTEEWAVLSMINDIRRSKS
jgi:hypothetical protein